MRPLQVSSSIAAAIAALFLSGCGGNAPVATPTVTVTATQPAPTPEPTSPTPEPTAPAPADTTGPPQAKKLPDVVGMNLQEGQDTMQAAGFFLLDDQDATGQGRLQVFDRNWVVTRQDPPAGSEVSVDTRVTLYAKKIGE